MRASTMGEIVPIGMAQIGGGEIVPFEMAQFPNVVWSTSSWSSIWRGWFRRSTAGL